MELLQAQHLRLLKRFIIPADFQLMLNLQELIELHFKEYKNPDFYAAELDTSLTLLNNLCKVYYRKTLYGLIICRLIREAKSLLRCSRLSARQIAFELGFADPANFSRFFLRETGERPRCYRKRSQLYLTIMP